MSKKFGFGLLGTGLVAPFHAKAIQNSEKCNLIAIAEIDKNKSEKFANEYNCTAYTQLKDLLNNDEIDIINVLTPNHLHKDAVMKIAEAKKSILVEKPPAMSLKDVDEMIATCNKNGVKLGVTLQCRIRAAVQAVKKAVDSGRFGKILQADAYMKWFRSSDYYKSDPWRSSRKSGAGVTIQHAFHYIDLLYYLAGPVANVQAKMTNLAHPEVELEDTLNAFLEFENGAQGTVQASTAFWPGIDIKIEIHGTEGTAIIAGEKIDLWKFKDELPEDAEIRKIGSSSIQTAATGPADFAYFDHQVVIDDMVNAIQQNREPVIAASLTRGTLEIALAMYKSANKAQVVHLPINNEDDVWE